jgi:hypothetical protein
MRMLGFSECVRCLHCPAGHLSDNTLALQAVLGPPPLQAIASHGQMKCSAVVPRAWAAEGMSTACMAAGTASPSATGSLGDVTLSRVLPPWQCIWASASPCISFTRRAVPQANLTSPLLYVGVCPCQFVAHCLPMCTLCLCMVQCCIPPLGMQGVKQQQCMVSPWIA